MSRYVREDGSLVEDVNNPKLKPAIDDLEKMRFKKKKKSVVGRLFKKKKQKPSKKFDRAEKKYFPPMPLS